MFLQLRDLDGKRFLVNTSFVVSAHGIEAPGRFISDDPYPHTKLHTLQGDPLVCNITLAEFEKLVNPSFTT